MRKKGGFPPSFFMLYKYTKCITNTLVLTYKLCYNVTKPKKA
nr:MAG TPA: hypothetical protein [Caudoviricetes sp.]